MENRKFTQQGERATALYCRLSVDDEGRSGDSDSIVHQKEILEKFARERGFGKARFFVDDGITGTKFNRPGLNAMVEEVKAGRISTVIIKDQSRIGRDALEIGLLKRTFDECDVRFISVTDGLDTAKGFDIMSLIRDVINEYFVAEASAKIRAVKRMNALAGRCPGRPPYGYKSVNGDNNVWEIDDEAAGNVREIFMRIIAGDGPHTIGKDFERRGIDTPMEHYRKLKGIPDADQDTTWFTFGISRIAENPAYIGQLVSQKCTTPSYKNHRLVIRPEEDWVVVENHHEAIIDRATYDTVQRLRANRRRPVQVGECTPLSGLLYCSGCKSKLSIACNTAKYQYYVCKVYRNSNKHYRKDCSRHGIRREIIERLALEKIQEAVALVRKNEAKFAEIVKKATSRDSEKSSRTKMTSLARADRRIIELDKLIIRTYEDHVAGKFSDERFADILGKFETEQKELIDSTKALRAEVEEIKNKTADLQSFMSAVKRWAEITELTAEVARTFIEKIVVHEAVLYPNPKRPGHLTRSQEVHIFLNFIGEFNPE